MHIGRHHLPLSIQQQHHPHQSNCRRWMAINIGGQHCVNGYQKRSTLLVISVHNHMDIVALAILIRSPIIFWKNSTMYMNQVLRVHRNQPSQRSMTFSLRWKRRNCITTPGWRLLLKHGSSWPKNKWVDHFSLFCSIVLFCFFFSVLFLLVLRIVLKMICASVFVCTTPNPRSIVWVPELNCLKAYHCIFIKRFLPSGVIMFIYPHIFPVAAVVVLVAFNLFVGTADGIPSIQSILSNCLLLVQFHVSQMLEWSYQCVKSVVVWAWFCGCVCVIVGSRKIIWLQHNFRQCFFVVVALMCLIVKNKWITIITARERNHSVIQSHSIPQEIL